MLAKLLVPEEPIGDPEPVAEAVETQRVDAFDDAFRVAQVPAHPAIDVRARLDPARELLFAGTLEIAQPRRSKRLATSNAACLNARLRIRKAADGNGHRMYLNQRPSA